MKIQAGNRQYRRAAQKFLRMQNASQPNVWRDVPREEWPQGGEPSRIKLWRHPKFVVQVFSEADGIRLSINRTTLNVKGDWDDNITWDEMQGIKNAVGFADQDAVEVYPAQKDVVNVANMRHLWIPTEPLSFVWRQGVESAHGNVRV